MVKKLAALFFLANCAAPAQQPQIEKPKEIMRAAEAAIAPCGIIGKLCGGQYAPCCDLVNNECAESGPSKNRCIKKPTAPPDETPGVAKYPPLRPTMKDVSDRNFRAGLLGDVNKAVQPFRWCPPDGHICSETERDILQQFIARVAVPKAIAFVKTLSASPSDLNFGYTSITLLNRLGTNYKEKSMCPDGGLWSVHDEGRHYLKPNYVIRRYRGLALLKSAACAKLITPDIADLLDLKIVNNKCVQGADFVLPTPLVFDKARHDSGAVTFNAVTQARLAAGAQRDKNALELTHLGHMWSTNYNNGFETVFTAEQKALLDPFTNGDYSKPPSGFVQTVHKNYEALCGDDEMCRHYRVMDAFDGFMHPGWTEKQAKLLRSGQDLFHHLWAQAQLTGNWCMVSGFDEDHSVFHMCANIGPGTRVLVRPFHPEKPEECFEDCATVTCEQLLIQFESRIDQGME